MTANEVLESFQELFRGVLRNPGPVLRRETTADDIEEWDSLAHINLIVAIERQFHLKFTVDELQELTTVGDMVDAVLSKSKSQ